MKRTGYLRLRSAASLVMSLMLVCGLAVFAETQQVVYPTGDPAKDVANVQAAVDQGGIVLLKAVDESGQPRAFNFGDFPVGWVDFSPSGAVFLGTAGQMVPDPISPYVYYSLGNDVQIVGEQIVSRKGNTSQTTMTTIEGGNVPIRNGTQRDVPGVGLRDVYGIGRFSVTGVRFQNSRYGTVWPTFPPTTVAEGRNLDVEISRCEFIDIKPGLAYRTVSGTRVPTYWYAWGPIVGRPPGSVRMADNRLSLTPGKWDQPMRAFESQIGVGSALGLISFGPRVDTLAGPAEITGNEVRGFGYGISILYGTSGGQAHIAANDITAEMYGITCEGTAKCLIEDNTIAGTGSLLAGIAAGSWIYGGVMQGSSIVRNEVEMGQLEEAGGITLGGRCVGNNVGQNVVTGAGAYALAIAADSWTPGDVAETNRFAGNNISHFQPLSSPVYGEGVHVFFDVGANRNVLLGNSGTVQDMGIGNFITGTSVPGPPPKMNFAPGKLRKDLLNPAGMRFEPPR